ncbi:MAG: hypothetical protein RIQ53_843 [Pseudomonadota bacterium]|jgi:hypothetical protein
MRSALFVDFDNVYSQLRQLSPAAAERFARAPVDWVHWLADALPPHDDTQPAGRRRLLVRRCYLNPNWYQKYRHAFLRAGFEVVDCPPVTSQGKTSTDIHMVLDIVDLLQHETHFDEFIVVSADADFTPVLLKLRRHDRRTAVLAVGYPSATYKASADLLIDERQFIDQALGLSVDEADAMAGGLAGGLGGGLGGGIAPTPLPSTLAAVPSAVHQMSVEATLPVPRAFTSAPPPGVPTEGPFSLGPLPTPGHGLWAASGVVPATPGGLPLAAASASSVLAGAAALPGSGTPVNVLRSCSREELQAISQRIRHLVAASPVPLAAGWLASQLKREFYPLLEQWNGQPGFKAFYRTLALSDLLWLPGSGGRLADPQRHAPEVPGSVPDGEGALRWQAAAQAARRLDAARQAVLDAAARAEAGEGDGPAADAALAEPSGAGSGFSGASHGAEADEGHAPGERMAAAGEEPVSHDVALLALAREVCASTQAPLLPPQTLRAILDELCADLQLQPYEPTETARRIVAACATRPGCEVSMREVVFLLRGMQLNGHVFGQGQDDVRTLARRLLNQILFLCEREQMALNEVQLAAVRRWIAGDLLDPPAR